MTDANEIVVDRGRRIIRTPGGTVIPFFVARLAIAAAVLVAGVAVTFGVPLWLLIPGGIWIASSLGMEIHSATWRHARQSLPDDQQQKGSTS